MEFFRRTPNIDFMGKRRITYVITALLMIGSFVLLATRGLNFGIDFTGGVVVEVSYPNTADVDQARDALAQAGFEEAQVQSFGSSRDLAVRVTPENDEDVNEVSRRVAAALAQVDPGVQVRRTEVVGPQVGEDLTEQGGLAILFTFIGILIYVGFRFEKKMAAGTVLAALHDPIVILGFFAATQLTFDLSVLASVLAVIGYSINDTVVVFDRVREVFREMRKATPTQVLNAAINQTLSRTLMTSFSVLFVVVSLYAFAGESLKGFSIAIIIGVLIGTYSSIFVAGALAHDLGVNAQDLMPVKHDDPELDALP
ncbi:protein translocase subunit SecF [Steroidobacter sp. S1-65]|uniref:Protein-export membrane protein SecF n=1 Tax=Steroidobacter gossypii TaxID=2805490 RepID=A0ABS1WUG7_9GAMM|nr:protein translocase subunit SecF [Steroidobacter gossypii]